MSTGLPIEPTPKGADVEAETRDTKIAHYGSPEFTKSLTEAFHRVKRITIQEDRAAFEAIRTNAK